MNNPNNSQDPHSNTPVLHAGVPIASADLAVILLHGRGGTAENILDLAPTFPQQGVAFLAPQAATHSWYPQSFMAPREANEPFLSSALHKVHTVVESLITAGLTRDRIVIGGFSQGACLASEYVFRHPARYGGLIAFTGGLIGPAGSLPSPAEHAAHTLEDLPALLCCGDPDPHVPWSRVQETANLLTSMGAAITLKRFPGRPHTISQEELLLAHAFLNQLLR